jgi:hypothetical protein
MRRIPRPPSVAVCMVTIAFVDTYARLRGLRRTLQLAASLARRPEFDVGELDARSPLVDETVRRVSLAAAFYPRRALCLEQSLALCLLLRRRGVAAELRLGAQPKPFYAHAWIEVNGVPVAEHEELPMNLTAFPSLGV